MMMKKFLFSALILITLFSVFPCVNAYAKEGLKVIDIEEGSEEAATEEASEGVTEGTGNGRLDSLLDAGEQDNITGDYKNPLEKVDGQTFFNKIYTKMFEGISAFQKIAALVVFVFFVISLVMMIVSLFGHRDGAGKYVVTTILCLVIIVAILYGVDIAIAFKSWLLA